MQNNGLSRLQERTAEARGVYGSLAPEEDLSALLETAASLENSVGITTTTASSREGTYVGTHIGRYSIDLLRAT